MASRNESAAAEGLLPSQKTTATSTAAPTAAAATPLTNSTRRRIASSGVSVFAPSPLHPRRLPLQQLGRKLPVRPRPPRGGVVRQDGQPMAGGFAQANGAGDDGAEGLGKVAAHLLHHL